MGVVQIKFFCGKNISMLENQTNKFLSDNEIQYLDHFYLFDMGRNHTGEFFREDEVFIVTIVYFKNDKM